METINPKDIRIGNWIARGGNGEYYQATPETISDLAGGRIAPTGIHITEQWLTDAGFVHETISQRGNKIYRKQAPEMKFDLEVINSNFFFGNRQIIYVHDLQNGYHWHSGDELIFNR